MWEPLQQLTEEYVAVCDGGPDDMKKHPLEYLDLTDGDIRCQYCNKLYKGVKWVYYNPAIKVIIALLIIQLIIHVLELLVDFNIVSV